jgi:hypothetical protein
MDELRNETQLKLNSSINMIIAVNRFFDSLDYLIASGQFDVADKVISKLLAKS